MVRLLLTIFITLMIAACGDSSKDSKPTPVSELQCDLSNISISFQDNNAEENAIGGDLTLKFPHALCNADRIVVNLINDKSDIQMTSVAAKTDKKTITIPLPTHLISTSDISIQAFLAEQSSQKRLFTLIDLVSITGPGGNALNHWQYGVERDPLMLAISKRGNAKYCSFDDGNVLIHDSGFNKYLEDRKSSADDLLFPAYEFDCTDERDNKHRAIESYDRDRQPYIHTYSAINDAMYYGNVSFDMFEQYLQIRPLDKLRIRVHHGPKNGLNVSQAFWDGAHINLNDAIYFAFGMASLDVISHEMAHGVLQNHSALKHPNDLEVEYTLDGRTLHEAYADMASVVAHYTVHDELNWVVGDENHAAKKRYLNKIETEPGAILSYLDYSAAGSNFYKRISTMTYPFYLLSNKWGVETAFELFTASARSCWLPNSNLEQSAQCVLQTARTNNLNTDDVITSFRDVKIKLNAKDTFSHFTLAAKKFNTQFTDQSVSDRTIIKHSWDFGDGNTSTIASPQHSYTASGQYTATLKVEDNQGIKDSLSRTFIINDQYCELDNTASTKAVFTTVNIAGTSIDFDSEQYDYTDQIIDVIAGENINIKIDGDKLDKDDETLWYIWVDLNDDAEYTGVDYSNADNSEQRLRLEQTMGEFGLDSEFTIPKKYAGKTLYMRLSADHFFPCEARRGSTLDVRLNIQSAI